MSSVNWWNCSINNLRDELRKRGLETYGAKPAMIKRLQSYEDNYKRRMDALRSKQSNTYRSRGASGDRKSSPPRSGGYKVLDEWKSSDEAKKDAKSNDKQSDSKTTEKKEEKKEAKKEESKKEESKQVEEEEKPPNYWGMTMSELRDQSTKKGLSVTGSKYELIDRLKQYDTYQRQRRQDEINRAAKAASEKKEPEKTEPPKTPTAAAKPAAANTTPKSTPTAAKTTPTASPAVAKTTSVTTPSPAVAKTTPAVAKTTSATTPSPAAAKTTPAASPSQTFAKPALTPAKQWGSPATVKTTPQASPATAKTTTPAKAATSPVAVDNEKKYAAMTFAQLKIECVNRKIEITGTKPDIIKRLVEHDKVKAAASATPTNQTPQKPATPTNQSTQAKTGGKPLLATAAPATPVAQKVQTAFKYVQAKPIMMTKIMQSDLISIDDPKEQELRFHYSSEVVPYHAGGRRKEWSNYKHLPDMTRDIIPDFETAAKGKTLVIYPITFKDLLDPALAKWKNNCKDFVVRFQDKTTVKKSMKGSVEMLFFTNKQVNDAKRELQAWNKDLKVEKLGKDLDLDAALKKVDAKLKNLEPLVNRLLFLNKIAVNVKEGNIATKFLDAASIVIARDPTDLSSKGYGYVEYLSREQAEKTLKKVKPLEIDRCRIDVQLFNKVPSLVADEMRGLVMPDYERVKMAESLTTALQQRIKSQGRTPDVSLNKQIEKLEADLALDAAVRKKLGFESLPEPAVYQTAQQRNSWQSGVFPGVDLGSVKKIWADPKDAEAASKAAKEAEEKAAREAKEKELKAAKDDGPPPAKQSRFDSTSRDKENRDSNRGWDRNRDNSRFGGSNDNKDKNDKTPSRFDNSRPGQRDRSSEDLRHKEPFNARQNSQTGKQSFMGNQKTTSGYQSNPPSLMGAGSRGASQGSNYSSSGMGDRNQQTQSLMGNFPGAGGNRSMGVTGAGRGRGDTQRAGMKPLLGQTSQSSLMRNLPGGTGSPMDLDSDSRPDDSLGMKGQDDFGNRSNRFDAGANRFDSGGNRFGSQSGTRPNVPSLLDNSRDSNRFGSQADKKVPSLFDTSGEKDFGRSKNDSFGRDTMSFSQNQRSGGFGRGSPQSSVASLMGSKPGQRSSFNESDMQSRFGQSRDDDQYGGQRGDTRSQFDSQKGAGRGSMYGRDSGSFGGQTDRSGSLGYDSSRGLPSSFGRGRGGVQNQNEPYGQKPFSQRAGADDRMQSQGAGRGRGMTDSKGRGMGSFSQSNNRFGAQSRFDDQDQATGSPYGGSTPQSKAYGQQAAYADEDYVDPMDQPLQFRRTPGAKAPTDFGAKPRDSLYPGGRSYPQYDEPEDQYGDQEPWTEEYSEAQGEYEDATETEPAFNRGVGALFNQLRSKAPPTQTSQSTYGQNTYGQKAAQDPYGSQMQATKSRFGQDPYGVQDTQTTADPYGRSTPQDTYGASRKSRFDQTTKADTSTKSSYDYSRYGTATSKASTADDPYASQRALIESMTAEAEVEADTDDYYNAGMAAKYGSQAGRDPYSSGYSQLPKQTSYGAATSVGKTSTAPPWQKQPTSSQWGVSQAGAMKEAAAVPLEDMSVDLLKELSSQVSDLRSQLQSENIPTESPRGAQAVAGDSKTKTTYKGGAIMYGDQTSAYAQQYAQGQYGQYDPSQYDQSQYDQSQYDQTQYDQSQYEQYGQSDAYGQSQTGYAQSQQQSTSYSSYGNQSQYGQSQYRRY